MSKHAPAIKPADDPAFKLPASLSALSLPLCLGGVVVLIVGWLIATYAVDEPKFGMSAYLTAFMYCLTLVLGSLFFVMIQHLVRAGWSTVVRRIAELVMVMVIPMAVLFLPILVTLWTSDGALYRWDNPSFAQDNHLSETMWANKTMWLSQDWFTVRACIYFAIWIGLAAYFFRGSVTQDETGERAATDRMQYWSGPAVMLYCGSMTFAMFDWVMSLAPMWFSTMFGVYLFAGSILTAHCILAVAAYLLQKAGAMRDEVTVEHYHDLGKLIFGFITFWAYISFSQYLLIWYANIPEETEWFYHRQLGTWGTLSLVLVFLHWALPFLGTMSRHARRRPTVVFFWAVYILVMHYIDIYWMIMPEAHAGEPGAHAVAGGFVGVAASLLCVLGMLGLITGLVLRVASQTRVVAVRDPRLGESIAFENM
ncbi:hypothetical protein Pla52o_17850 [Novipirellula galeiformis]|uniref:Quinol:cytochrome C oxidoreductase n=1 Tax=Novipirellula galeiformis TaxID=2528004 RepID=A0A5C6CHY7_9BACT|nr:hypothetical protein [Novipirellula galeiformis]TWU23862.1 hypothetical protein Pla52o_17850 [Novipirellula galeiformis]